MDKDFENSKLKEKYRKIKEIKEDIRKNFAFLLKNEYGEPITMGVYPEIKIKTLEYLIKYLKKLTGDEWEWTMDRLQKVVLIYRKP